MTKINRFIKDPMSALTHFIGLVLSIIATYKMVQKAAVVGTSLHVAAFAIFGGSLVLLYTASTVYHAVNRPKRLSDILHRIDHIMIFVLIAGTYTPICLIPLDGKWGFTLLTIIWSIAIGGFFLKLFWMNAPRWLYTAIYVLAGWIVIIAIYPLSKTLSTAAIWWMVMGGIIYTLGAIIYGTKWPKINFRWFGFHEIFHLFVLGGSFCHFIVMYKYIIFL